MISSQFLTLFTHLPAGLLRHRPAGGDLLHPQHLRHRRRPTHPRERPVAGPRRLPPPGHRRHPRRGDRRGRHRVRRGPRGRHRHRGRAPGSVPGDRIPLPRGRLGDHGACPWRCRSPSASWSASAPPCCPPYAPAAPHPWPPCARRPSTPPAPPARARSPARAWWPWPSPSRWPASCVTPSDLAGGHRRRPGPGRLRGARPGRLLHAPYGSSAARSTGCAVSPAASPGATPCAARSARPPPPSALMIGVAVVSLFTVFGASLKATMDQTVSRSFAGDVAVSAPSFGAGGSGLSPQAGRGGPATARGGHGRRTRPWGRRSRRQGTGADRHRPGRPGAHLRPRHRRTAPCAPSVPTASPSPRTRPTSST